MENLYPFFGRLSVKYLTKRMSCDKVGLVPREPKGNY
jgi:hypothetical protein